MECSGRRRLLAHRFQEIRKRGGLGRQVTGTIGDLYATLAEDVMGTPIGKFPTATGKLSALMRNRRIPFPRISLCPVAIMLVAASCELGRVGSPHHALVS
jgi:hypothetical protein